MKNIKWVFVLYSLAALLSMFAIGISVGLRSVPGILVSIFILIMVMGLGFKTKKKMREQGLL
ncbi:MAG: YlaF family protein [Paenisporosarcina sp.]